jgi:hypothetical protein
MKVGGFLCLTILSIGCNPIERDENKSVVKLERYKDVTVEMFNHSSAYTDSPMFLIVQKGFKIDTICRTSNITDFDLDKDTLKLSFYGLPKLYNEEIVLKERVFNQITIVIDTTGE